MDGGVSEGARLLKSELVRVDNHSWVQIINIFWRSYVYLD